MEIKILTDRFRYRDAVAEERDYWLYTLLAYLGVEIDKLNELDGAEISDYLFENKIEIIDYPTLEAIEVMLENQLVGEWGGPEFKLKSDPKDGELYYEVTIECWSIIDEEIAMD